MTSSPARGGFTLLEAIVALTVFSIVLGSAAIALNAIHRAKDTVRRHRRTAESFSRLELRLRRDVHRAHDVTFVAGEADSEDGRVLRLDVGGGETIDYRPGDGQLLREARRGENVLHRDAYQLEQFHPSWAPASESPPDGRRPSHRSVALVLTRRTPEGASSPPPLRIEVALRPHTEQTKGASP